ncbi:MAG TPA: hypothetical protein VKN99_14595 [Polyangia bacterium]|nr:hypothetical protein [Polyangia bacterium]
MTGVVVVTHGLHGAEMVRDTQAIVGDLPELRVVTVSTTDPPEITNARLETASYEVDSGLGVLFLVDLHGATPSNLCMALMDGAHNVEVLCGLNMAMLLKLATCERKDGPRDLAELLLQTGRRSIRLGSEITGRLHIEEIE